MKHIALTAVIVLLLAATLFGYMPQQSPASKDPATAGIALYLKGDFDGASKALREAVKRDKSDAKAWHYLGLTLMSQADQKKAGEAFSKAQELRIKTYDKEFASAEELITEEKLVRLTGLLQELIEVREKLVEVHNPQNPVDLEKLELENTRARAVCFQQNTKVVDGHMQLKKSDLKITKPRAIKSVQPDFPSSGRMANVSAAVILRAMVGPDGFVRYLEVRSSSGGDAFTDAGKAAAMRTKFQPASICGQAVSSPIQLEYSWNTSP